MNVKHLRLVSAFKGKHTFHVSRYSSRYFCSDGVFEIDIVSHVEIYSCFKGMHRTEFGTSGGTNIRDRGPHNAIPFYNYLSGTGKSHVYYGPGYYVPSENRWMAFHEYRSIPRETKRDAILFESEDDWVTFQRKRDAEHPPSGISMSGVPTMYTGVPVPTLLPSQSSAWNRKWNGAGYFLPSGNKWFRDQDSPGIPKDSQLFYNEEDWIKFKHMTDNPVMVQPK